MNGFHISIDKFKILFPKYVFVLQTQKILHLGHVFLTIKEFILLVKGSIVNMQSLVHPIKFKSGLQRKWNLGNNKRSSYQETANM